MPEKKHKKQDGEDKQRKMSKKDVSKEASSEKDPLKKKEKLEQQPSKEEVVKEESKKNGKRILIVEDEHPLAHALELKFHHEGFDTVVVGNGRQALDELQKDNVHAVILDLIMPEMDGFTFLDQLGGTQKTTKVIVVSNLGQKEDEERVMAHENVAAYFVKSNTPITSIVEKVKSVLS